MITITNKKDCCGCTACMNSCPVQCITMQPDNEGFLYPVANAEKCINCGKCERVCPLQHRPEQHEIYGVYGAQHLDDAVRYTSSSGGMFTLIAEEIFAQGGVVFGAELNEALEVQHCKVEKAEDFPKLRGSKYVQSVLGHNFQEAKQELEAGKQVLFSGTPCQLGGLTSFLGKDYPNLFKVDVVCHGSPSPKVYHKHLQELAAKAGEPVTTVKFRDKADGWLRGKTYFATEHQIFGASKRKETYMRLFLNNIIIRPTCEECAFNNKRSQADITIADYWGISKQFPEFDDDKGTTLVIINTPKGQAMWEKLLPKMKYLETTYELGAKVNQAVARSLPLHPGRKFFFEHFDEYTLPEFVLMLLDNIPVLK